jgi:hypothetical protein
VKDLLWPADPDSRKRRKTQYRNLGLFVISTTVLVKYGRQVADLIYNQQLLEETIRSGQF